MNGKRTHQERKIHTYMVLTSEQRERLTKRLESISDCGGIVRVAELAGVTSRVIQKAQSGGNVRVETMESVTAALLLVEAERKNKVKKVEKALI